MTAQISPPPTLLDYEPKEAARKQERTAIIVIAAVQFVNVVDFMMVMPLGPDFAVALGIRLSHMGVLAGSYTLAAALSGLLGSLFLDRIGRRTALVMAVAGLAVGTAAGAFAIDFRTLLWARVLAGAFGGPATAIGFAIIGDLVPHERRGAALGKIMMGFSAASIIGVPAGLEVARIGGWNAPFVMVGLLAAFVAVLAYVKLPPLKNNVISTKFDLSTNVMKSLIRQRTVLISYGLLFSVMMGGFLIFPNIAGFVQVNQHFPRNDMGRLYFIGGICSLIVMGTVGKLVDKFGSVPWFTLGSFGFLGTLYAGMYQTPPTINAYVLFIGFMIFGTLRNISTQTLTSKVPIPSERAGFMSLQSAVQHTAMSAGAILSSRLLSSSPNGELIGIESIVVCSAILILTALFLVVVLDRQVRKLAH
jgi:predicted MFS family arabinose efflux permease